jgi:predicted amidohydrolase
MAMPTQIAITMAMAGLTACAELPVPRPLPPLEVAVHGEGDGPRLLAVQAWMQPADYATAARFEARLRGFLDEARDRGLLHERTVVVLPEYIGTWLVAVDEGASVYSEDTLGGAMTGLATAHLPGFLWSSWTADVDDRDAFAAFTQKATAMATAYDDTMRRLADDFDVTLVGGSIILPDARLRNGVLEVVPGAPLENVAVIYDRDGAAIGLSKKVFPTADEHGFLSAAATSDIAVVDTPAGRLGVLVCADAWFPDSYARLVEAGAELLAVPTFHAHNDIWEKPWGGYSGQQTPADVDAADVGRLTEREAWEKYAIPARARAAGLRGAITTPLRGILWDLGDDGEALLVDGDGHVRMSRADGPGLFLLQLP